MHALPPSEGRYFENLPTTPSLYLYEDKPKQHSLPASVPPPREETSAKPPADNDANEGKSDSSSEAPNRPKKMVMPSIPRLIVVYRATWQIRYENQVLIIVIYS